MTFCYKGLIYLSRTRLDRVFRPRSWPSLNYSCSRIIMSNPNPKFTLNTWMVPTRVHTQMEHKENGRGFRTLGYQNLGYMYGPDPSLFFATLHSLAYHARVLLEKNFHVTVIRLMCYHRPKGIDQSRIVSVLFYPYHPTLLDSY